VDQLQICGVVVAVLAGRSKLIEDGLRMDPDVDLAGAIIQ
jgi:hypothetical protein